MSAIQGAAGCCCICLTSSHIYAVWGKSQICGWFADIRCKLRPGDRPPARLRVAQHSKGRNTTESTECGDVDAAAQKTRDCRSDNSPSVCICSVVSGDPRLPGGSIIHLTGLDCLEIEILTLSRLLAGWPEEWEWLINWCYLVVRNSTSHILTVRKYPDKASTWSRVFKSVSCCYNNSNQQQWCCCDSNSVSNEYL